MSGKAEASAVATQSSMSKEELALSREEFELRKAEIAAAEKRTAVDLEERRIARQTEDQRFKKDALCVRQKRNVTRKEIDRLRNQEIALHCEELNLQSDSDKRTRKTR